MQYLSQLVLGEIKYENQRWRFRFNRGFTCEEKEMKLQDKLLILSFACFSPFVIGTFIIVVSGLIFTVIPGQANYNLPVWTTYLAAFGAIPLVYAIRLVKENKK